MAMHDSAGRSQGIFGQDGIFAFALILVVFIPILLVDLIARYEASCSSASTTGCKPHHKK